MKDEKNPLNPVNQICARLKQFLSAHKGFNRDNLQDYLNLFCFIMNPSYDRLEKMKMLLTSSMSSTRILKYHEFYKVKSQ